MTLLKNLTATNVPQLITGTNINFNTATFWGYSSFHVSGFPVNNTNRVFVGVNSGQCFIPVATGASYNFTLGQPTRENIQNFWLIGTSGDGVFVSFYP